MTTHLRKWLALGTGVGIRVRGADLDVVAVRVRPSGARVLGFTTIESFRERPSTEWGAEYAAFAAKHGAAHKAAWVLLPRRDSTLRQIALPGVPDSELSGAVALQIDTLHPYDEDDACPAWARIEKSQTVAVAVSRRSAIDRYAALFSEAGVKVAVFTFAACGVYSALRAFSAAPAEGVLAVHEEDGEVEIYGESPARPLYSALIEAGAERAARLAAAELRLEESMARPLAEVLPVPRSTPEGYDSSRAALPYATALAGALPWPALEVNLLPPEHRQTSSRLIYAPTVALAAAALVLAVALVARGAYQNNQYMNRLEAEIARLEPAARRAAAIDREVAALRARTGTIDNFRRRTRADLDTLNALTELLAPPAWLSGLEIQRGSVNLSGYADQAAGLLKTLDSAPQFQNSEFTMPITRSGKHEEFRLRAQREGALP